MQNNTLVFLAFGCALLAGSAGATVTITFAQPDKYTDMPFASRDKQDIMDELQKHFDKLGATLPAGQDLKVEILDIDLAGRIESSKGATRDIRILRGGADWPIIAVRYSLALQGKVLKSGEERIADTHISWALITTIRANRCATKSRCLIAGSTRHRSTPSAAFSPQNRSPV